ncbi:MAG TPA: DUF262 domain-containing protein [Anaerolineaceae bacterium]|nr:DUF262 domain-containing protein [Anaerolineaceae bacterium]
MPNFETNPKQLKRDLLSVIDARDMALPDFQRDFVWQPRQTLDLIISLSKSYPAGSLLRMESDKPMFQPRAFAGAPALDGHKPKYLVLDGQQRLTSLYQALYGTGDYLFYVKLKDLVDGKDVEDAFFYERRDRALARCEALDKQAANFVLPLSVLFGGEGFHAWLYVIQDVLNKGENANELSSDLRKALSSAYDKYVSPILTYEFPVVTLTNDPPLEAVCTIFETLNNTGVRLSVFDLLSARYFAEGYKLRELWEKALAEAKYLDQYKIDPYYVLQVICSQVSNSVKRADVLKLKASEVVAAWGDAIWGMDEFLKMLHNECGVLTPELLSYNTILIPAAAMFMKNKGLRGVAWADFRPKLKRWYWCSVFGQTYEVSYASQTMTDISQFQIWLKGGLEPESVSKFTFNSNDLYKTTTKQRAIYRGLMCLVLRTPSLDFHSTQPITSALLEQSSIDDHHIFPKAYLTEADKNIDPNLVDCILNRTLIDKETNQRIGKNPPSMYLQAIRDHLKDHSGDPTVLERLLSSHQLPSEPDSPLWRDDFEDFCLRREVLLKALVEQAVAYG